MITVPCPPRPGHPRLALTVPAGDPAALAAALACGADALVLAAPAPNLRGRIEHRPDRWFPPFGTRRCGHESRADGPDAGVALYAAVAGPDDPALPGLMALAPDAVLLRDARSGRDVAALGARLAVLEAEGGLPDGGTGILAQVGHPLGVLDARGFAGASPRLAGLGFDGAALAGIVGADVAAQARGLVRLAAAAAGVPAFAALGAETDAQAVAAARRDGLGLLLAESPARIAGLRACLDA